MTMLMASEPPVDVPDIIQLSKVYHHVNEDICLGIELTIKESEWVEIPKIESIEVHKYNVLDIKPNEVWALYCIIHEKNEQVIYKNEI